MADVLFLCQRIPYPPDKGEKIRFLNVLNRVRRHHRVHLGCLTDDPDDLAHIETVRAMVESCHVAPVNRRLGRLLCLRGLLTGDALSAAYYGTPGLRRWVRETLRQVQPAAAVVSSSNMAPYVLDAPERPPVIVSDLVDVDSQKWHDYAATARAPMRWVYQREAARIEALERRLMAASRAGTVVSEAEAALLRAVCPQHADRALAVPNGVDVDYFTPDAALPSPYAPGRTVLAFTGAMDYPPNIDAARWFVEAVLPRLAGRLPDPHVVIAGSRPAPEVRALGERPDVTVTGRVPDIRPYGLHAAACIAPLRIARGIQNKVLEAMALGRPTVVTRNALTGIAAEPGREVLVADEAGAFADAVVAACDPVRGAALGAAARAFVLANHSWETTMAPFDRLLGDLPGDSGTVPPASPRTARVLDPA